MSLVMRNCAEAELPSLIDSMSDDGVVSVRLCVVSPSQLMRHRAQILESLEGA
ncbi:MAG: hypothetical protein RL189_1990, partial [Pseudomonadota bacterium]